MERGVTAVVYSILAGAFIVGAAVCFAVALVPWRPYQVGNTVGYPGTPDELWFLAWLCAAAGVGLGVLAVRSCRTASAAPHPVA